MTEERISRVGEYSGYSRPRYDGWVRSSQYVEARDGTRLAVDVFRPTSNGKLEEEPLPVAWTSKRYLRARLVDGEVRATLMDSVVAKKLLAHGYALASADMRGTGASFGNRSETSPPSDSTDGYDVNEWLAAQPFCDGSTGMFGISYEGRMQLAAASQAPPHLKAILPEVSPFDWYSIIYRGGLYTPRFERLSNLFRSCDVDPPVAPVDEDADGSLAAEASRIHQAGNSYEGTAGKLPYRDSVNSAGERQWLERSGEELVPGIAASGIATYHRVGWFANVRIDQLLWFANLSRAENGGRHRIMIGPWGAGSVNPDPDHWEMWATETLRFLDYWVRGIDNGIMDEPPVVYTLHTSTKERTALEWHFDSAWPPPAARPAVFSFAEGPSESVASVNDGVLAEGEQPGPDGARDELTVDYSIVAPAGDGRNGPDVGLSFVAYDERCLTYTSAPLDDALEVRGHPVVELHVSTTAEDADFNVHLLDVDPAGVSTFVTHKVQRASHRKVAEPSFYFFDVPWHTLNESDRAPIPSDEIVSVAFDLLPCAHVFRPGHRLRVTIAGADAAIMSTHVSDPPARLRIHRDAERLSRITLPVIPR